MATLKIKKGDTLDDSLTLLGHDAEHSAGLTLVVTGKDVNGVTLLDF